MQYFAWDILIKPEVDQLSPDLTVWKWKALIVVCFWKIYHKYTSNRNQVSVFIPLQ